MNLEAFNNLELIPELLKTVKDLKILVNILKPELSTKRGVAMFLGVTERQNRRCFSIAQTFFFSKLK